MAGLSDYTAKHLIDWMTGSTAMPSLPTVYLALFTTAPTSDAGTGGTEVSGGSYARTACGTSSIFPASSGSTGTEPSVTPATVTNSAGAITFPMATGSWGTVLAWGIYDATSSGNLICWDWLGNYPWIPCTVSNASPGIITAHAHGYSLADPFVFTTKYGGTIPTFSQSNFTGVLTVAATVATDTFTATNSATAVNTSATGNGMVRKIVQQAIATNVTPSFSTSSLTLNAA